MSWNNLKLQLSKLYSVIIYSWARYHSFDNILYKTKIIKFMTQCPRFSSEHSPPRWYKISTLWHTYTCPSERCVASNWLTLVPSDILIWKVEIRVIKPNLHANIIHVACVRKVNVFQMLPLTSIFSPVHHISNCICYICSPSPFSFICPVPPPSLKSSQSFSSYYQNTMTKITYMDRAMTHVYLTQVLVPSKARVG